MDAVFGLVHVIFLAVIGLLVYFFPLAIARMRKIERENYKRVMIINAFAGWTDIGWLFALITACACPSTSIDPTIDLWPKSQDAGVSGLNPNGPSQSSAVANPGTSPSRSHEPPYCGHCGARLPAGSKFCNGCGATIVQAPDKTGKGRDYQDAGVSVPQAQKADQLTGGQRANTVFGRPPRMGLVLGLTIIAVACFVGWVMYSNSQQPSTTTVSAPRPGAQPEFQPRDIRASGRLPQRLRGVSLGVGYDVAGAQNTDLSPDRLPNSDDQSSLSSFPKSGAAGLQVTLERGRVAWIRSYVEQTSPSEAGDLQNDVLGRLGKPDSEVRLDPDETKWVWIDGNLRIRFSNAPYQHVYSLSTTGDFCPPDARSVSLELADWPFYRSRPESTGSSEFSRRAAALSRDWGNEDWGESTLPYEPTKELPRELGGLQLGIEPLLAGNLYPRMKTEVYTGERTSQCLDEGLDFLCVESWRGRVYQITQNREVSEADFDAEGLRLWIGGLEPHFTSVSTRRGFRLIGETIRVSSSRKWGN